SPNISASSCIIDSCLEPALAAVGATSTATRASSAQTSVRRVFEFLMLPFGRGTPSGERGARSNGVEGYTRPPGKSCGSELQQNQHVHYEQDGEEDRPAVEIALHERAAAERARTGADAERARQAGVLARVHQ